jgi:hypothetical protein
MLPPSFPCNPQLRRTSRSQEGGTLPARKGRDRVGSLAVLGSQILLSLVSLQFARVVSKSAPSFADQAGETDEETTDSDRLILSQKDLF